MATLLQQLNGELSAVVEVVRRSLVQIHNGRSGAGAGVIWRADGLIVTNAHVVSGRLAQVSLPDGQKLPAELVAIDKERDLAALKVEARHLPAIAQGDSDTLKPGQLVLSLGHPWGVAGAVSAGPVIDVGVPPEIGRRGYDFVQAGLQLRPGHSGGPMVDIQGRLVGINTLITGPAVGLAVPVARVKQFLQQDLPKPTPAQVFI